MDFSDWSAKDYVLLGTALAATAADVKTTQDLLGKGGQETNPLLGKHPSDSALVGEAVGVSGLAAALAAALPAKYRGAFLGGWTGLEGSLAYNNTRIDPKGKPHGFDLTPQAAPALAGAALGYFLPSGSGSGAKLTPDVRPGYTGVTYTRHF